MLNTRGKKVCMIDPWYLKRKQCTSTVSVLSDINVDTPAWGIKGPRTAQLHPHINGQDRPCLSWAFNSSWTMLDTWICQVVQGIQTCCNHALRAPLGQGLRKRRKTLNAHLALWGMRSNCQLGCPCSGSSCWASSPKPFHQPAIGTITSLSSKVQPRLKSGWSGRFQLSG